MHGNAMHPIKALHLWTAAIIYAKADSRYFFECCRNALQSAGKWKRCKDMRTSREHYFLRSIDARRFICDMLARGIGAEFCGQTAYDHWNNIAGRYLVRTESSVTRDPETRFAYASECFAE